MITIDVTNNGQQIAYITVEKSPSSFNYIAILQDNKHPSGAEAVAINHIRTDDYLTLLRKVFTKLEESSNK